MEQPYNINSEAVKVISEGGDPPVDSRLRKDWNDYVIWLDSKGMKGNPSLDKDENGFKMIEEYRKINPNTTITKETIIPIQKEFQKYRDWSLNEVKSGKAAFSEGVTEDNYMKALSVVDGIPGQRTTSFMFPESYLKTIDKSSGKLVDEKKEGFALVKNK